MDSSRAVEAASLGAIASVAANPPLHPSTPMETPAIRLVLYIARVPGSRDVFLTPIKPRVKVVTAEDVRSSLYYVHVHSREDVQAIDSWPGAVNSDPPRTVPPALFVEQPDSWPLAEGVQQSPASLSSTSIARKPIATSAGADEPFKHGIQRKSLPVQPRHQSSVLHADILPHNSSNHANSIDLLGQNGHGEDDDPNHNSLSIRRGSADVLQSGSLTLIRRDPSSGEQWNVASIYNPLVDASSVAARDSSGAVRTKQVGAPLYLDVSNPAYLQFVRGDRSTSKVNVSSLNSSNPNLVAGRVFRRRLHMSGPRSRKYDYERPTSTSTIERSPAFVDRRSKGYTFCSPWNGQCEFSTGATGRSLTCRHYLSFGSTESVAEVSELRFNLPTNSRNATGRMSENRVSYFNRLHTRAYFEANDNKSPTLVIGDDGRIDLTLGQEKAGGGFGGKQAKMGKLIIQPEGLKMLDLLVAANVGLWWRAYDRL